jgi:hypothetical protein
MGAKHKNTRLGFTALMLLSALLLWLLPAFGAGTITENFANNQYNTDLWSLWNTGQGITPEVVNERLEVAVAGNGYAGLNASSFTLIGDFEMKVDFTLINWPESNGTQLTMATYTMSPQNLFHMGRANTIGQEQYFSIILGNYSSTGVTEPALGGTLRMVRTGNKMEAFYWNGTIWESFGSNTDASLGTRVAVTLGIGPYANNYSGIPAKAAFDNIQIDYTTLGPSFWQSNPGPGILFLLLD